MELENKLNEFLADLNIFYRKLQNNRREETAGRMLAVSFL